MVDFTKVAQHFQQKANEDHYKVAPVDWARDRMGIFLWSAQRELLNALVTHKKVAVKTCHSIGKSFSSALAMAWWVDTRGNDSIVISSAPTYAQVNGILWQELRRFHTQAGLPGRITQDARWQMPLEADGRSTDILVGQGRKPADTDVSAFQGTHRTGGVLVVLDEAGGLPDSLFTGAETITTAPHDRQLLIGNPDDPSTEFARIFKEKPDDWYLMTVSAYDTPNFTGEEIPEYLKKSLPQPDWVESRRKDWGETSPRFMSKVLAEFPDTADDGLFNLAQVDAAIRNDEHQRSATAAPIMGVDVARFGSDSSVAMVRYGNRVEYLDSWDGLDTYVSAERIAKHANDIGCRNIRVDAVGVGAGVIDNLVRLLPDANIYEMHGSAASPDNLKWYNARAFWYDDLRRQIAEGEITLPDHKTLRDEFGVIKYEFRGSAMLIMSKDDMRKQGIKSPDFLDAVVYTCADMSGGIEGDRILTEEDLYDDDLEWEDMMLGGREPFSFAPY